MNTTSLISNCISKYTTILYYDSFRRNRRISYNLCARQRASKLKYTKQATIREIQFNAQNIVDHKFKNHP